MFSQLKQAQGLIWAVFMLLSACSGPANSQPVETETAANPPASSTPAFTPSAVPVFADVLSVQTSGNPGEYSFTVEVASPDENCFQYADWWEVIDQEGHLIYRRVLLHSHADEQPFRRSGGPMLIQEDTIVWVRAHMNVDGYGGKAMKGSVQAGFQATELNADFAANLANQPPLPQDCDF